MSGGVSGPVSDLASMTGFASAGGEAAWGRWRVEAKSVNGRGLDVRVMLPPGLEPLERGIKAAATARFSRGSLQVALRLDLDAGGGLRVDTTALAHLLDAWRKASGEDVPSGAALATLMTVKGVVDSGGGDSRALAEDAAAMATLEAGALEALDGLAEARREEGARLAGLLSGLLDALEETRTSALAAAEDQPARVRIRLERQLAELGAGQQVDGERLAAETALSAARADVREELDRLASHVAAARTLLAAGSPAGRKLDFLCQELYREANTLCSKSASLPLTEAGLALKSLIDQFKEQAANVE